MNETLELLKELLNIDIYDDGKDTILTHYIDTAKQSIQSHLNYKESEIEGLFEVQIVNLAMFYYKNKNNQGIIQQSQGSRSLTIERGIPKEILQSLPMPRVRIVGGR